MKIGYCTNVHAGVTIDEVKSNLEKYTLDVKRQFCPDTEMGIGLWLSQQAARDLIEMDAVAGFAKWLASRGLNPFTFNAFPYSDFHQAVVKHKVYQPTWAEKERVDYTIDIAEIQSRLLDENEFGTISTLPLGWPNNKAKDFMSTCADNLKQCAKKLSEIKDQTGRHIFLCIEPEPGCIFDRSKHVVDFFEEYFDGDEFIRTHIGVCHDICHSAVMNESQEEALNRYRQNEIYIGKYQISSAIKIEFDSLNDAQRITAIAELESFAEDRYLHQTMIVGDKGNEFFEDLPIALTRHKSNPFGSWRIHFHVPIFVERFGLLGTTHRAIDELLENHSSDAGFPTHFELETYAWTVLPEILRANSLADGIAQELKFFRGKIK